MTFDVASVRPVKPGDIPTSIGIQISPGKFVAKYVTAKTLIGSAFQVNNMQISGGPNWVNEERFDVEARTENSAASPDQISQMLQSLLADRFRLKVTHDVKESTFFALVVGKNGPKIKLSADQSPTGGSVGVSGRGPRRGLMRGGGGRMRGTAISMSQFANQVLSVELEKTVVDKTELKGLFDIELSWDPGNTQGGEPNSSVPRTVGGRSGDFSGTSLIGAVQEQLGLRLDRVKGPLALFVIDHIEWPSAN